MAVEVLKQQLADLTRDYTGACEAIRQLEANVAAYRDKLDDLTEQRADLQQDRARLRFARDAALLNHTAALVEIGRMRDETIALRAAVTAAEAASEAVAGEVREAAAAVADRAARVQHIARDIRALPLPTPSAALQRVREEAESVGYDRGYAKGYAVADDLAAPKIAAAQREGAERALRDVAQRPYDVPRWEVSGDLLPADAVLRALWDGWVAERLAKLFPTPDAGGK